MNKQRIKRSLFFWVDRLQIRKRERYSISVLLLLFVVLVLTNVFYTEKLVPEPDNHTQILADFEQRSALIEREKLIEEQKYAGIITEEPEAKIESSITMSEPISINTATSSQLIQLPGIGNAYAQRIIEYRETNGDFTSVDELVNVKGIGERTLEKIKPFIKL